MRDDKKTGVNLLFTITKVKNAGKNEENRRKFMTFLDWRIVIVNNFSRLVIGY